MRTTLSVQCPQRVPVAVSLAPGLSMLALITDALGGRSRGAPESWRRLVRSVAVPRDTLVLRSLTAPGFTVAPDLVFPGVPTGDITIESQIELLRDLSGDVLLADLAQSFDGRTPPAHWQEAVDHPERWMRAYADLLDRVWGAMSEVWRRARPLIDREIERVAVAAARGATDAVLNDLHSGCMFRDGAFSFPDAEPGSFSIGSRRLVLMPMLSGRSALVSSLDGPEIVWIGYPLPVVGALTSAPARGRAKAAPLVLLLGEARATVLTALDRPRTMGRLAEITGNAPNAVTYHCDRLETAGLIERRRSGREVHVHRTDRGDALVGLLAT
ncbi:hypothetical protein Sru01_12840 [Sphaerisporangium rufum]|uniref:Helix-turn-helix domain-containing protein n=1 Tax=Sphaerisporangium rufum TaxID=1381558 RepID=A0A919UZH2_9ACTN|nr:winged helix-turn-helix domain-containing protein [Sphaerisporangium rufum]GII76302.1 hypothetical protein Sru01_12840 [Sphaerisporangium rufum]